MTARERAASALSSVAHRFVEAKDGMACVEVAASDARAALAALRDRGGFDSNTFVTAIDLHPAEPRYLVVWQLLSITNNERVRVQAPVPSNAAVVDTVTDLWPGTAYSERECYDMFGIQFRGHAGLKRLLMPDAYEHFPLRKDFPHAGIEPDRLYREWDARRRQRSEEAEESRA